MEATVSSGRRPWLDRPVPLMQDRFRPGHVEFRVRQVRLDVDGRMRLVALEYVIPAAAWTSPEPPRLFGRELKLNALNLWVLHLWLWKKNPSGLFTDWNPAVRCDDGPPPPAGM